MCFSEREVLGLGLFLAIVSLQTWIKAHGYFYDTFLTAFISRLRLYCKNELNHVAHHQDKLSFLWVNEPLNHNIGRFDQYLIALCCALSLKEISINLTENVLGENYQ